MPTKGCWDRTSGKLIQELNKCNGDICKVIGDYNDKAGAWIRFNPLDGKGVKNDNVSDYRYALVESDVVELEKQKQSLENWNYPLPAWYIQVGKVFMQ